MGVRATIVSILMYDFQMGYRKAENKTKTAHSLTGTTSK